MVNRQLAPMAMQAGRDHDYDSLRQHLNAGSLRMAAATTRAIPCTPAVPRASQGRAARHGRLCGGAGGVMQHIYCGKPGGTYFSTSDIGWVVLPTTSSTVLCWRAWPPSCTRACPYGPTGAFGGVWWKVQGHGDVQRAHGDPCAEKQDRRCCKSTTCPVCVLCFGGRAAGRTPRSGSAGSLGKPLSTTTGRPETRLAHLVAVQRRRGKSCQQVWLARQACVRYNVKLLDDQTGARRLASTKRRGRN